MLLSVVHETAFAYASKVKTAQHMAHLKPLQTMHQRLLSHRLAIDPAPAQTGEAIDVYGNTRAFFSLQSDHEKLKVVAESVVQTHAPAPAESAITWEQARERLRYHRTAAYDPATEFTFASSYVPRHDAFIDYARPSFAAGRPHMAAAQDLMTRIHADFSYRSDATDITTPALKALEMRKGVCQDFAHIMLGCLRSLGLPARYVSGYLLTSPPPGRARLVGGDASHAWVSVYVPGEDGPGMWTDLDPTNNRRPGEDYVTLARGRDYGDVSPLRGVIHGGAKHTLRVAVTVSPLAAPPQAEPVRLR